MRIMLVEDKQEHQTKGSAAIEAVGHQVVLATTLQEAVKNLPQQWVKKQPQPVDAVIIDLFFQLQPGFPPSL